MAEVICIAVERIAEPARAQDFQVKDKKGRAIGAYVSLATVVYRERAPDERGGWYRVPAPGVYFETRVHATRNGELFGASHGTNRYAKAEEREAAIAKYFASAAKRAAKIAAC